MKKIDNLDELRGFYDGLAVFTIRRENKCFSGLIDDQGTVMVDAVYSMMHYSGGDQALVWQERRKARRFDIKSRSLIDERYANPAPNGRFFVHAPGGRCGVVDALGRQIIPYKYRRMIGWDDYYIACNLHGKYGFLSTEGNERSPFIYDELNPNPNNISSRVSYCYDYIPARQGHEWFYVNRSGERLSSQSYASLYVFTSSGYAVFGAMHDGALKYGLIDRAEQIVIPAIYNQIDLLDESYICVSVNNDRCGLVNLQGEILLPIMYARVYSVERDKGLLELTDEQLNMGVVRLISKKITDISSSENGLTACPPSKLFDVVIPFEYWQLLSCADVFIASRRDSLKWGVLSLAGTVLIPFEYDRMECGSTSEFIAVQKNNEWYYINLQNERVLF